MDGREEGGRDELESTAWRRRSRFYLSVRFFSLKNVCETENSTKQAAKELQSLTSHPQSVFNRGFVQRQASSATRRALFLPS